MLPHIIANQDGARIQMYLEVWVICKWCNNRNEHVCSIGFSMYWEFTNYCEIVYKFAYELEIVTHFHGFTNVCCSWEHVYVLSQELTYDYTDVLVILPTLGYHTVHVWTT